MNFKTKKFRNLLIILFMITSLYIIPAISTATFDHLNYTDDIEMSIGDWMKVANPSDIVQIIDNESDWDPFDNDNEIFDYLIDLIFENYDPNDSNNNVLNPLYEDYTLSEVKEVIDLINDFTTDFLVIDPDTGMPVYPDFVEVEPIPLNIPTPLLPGEVRQINQVVSTADIVGSNNAWIPITIIVSIEAPKNAPSGFDISDFNVELLFDSNAFDDVNPLRYRYVLHDANSNAAKNRVSGDFNVSSFNNELTSSLNYDFEVYHKNNNSHTSVFYRHQLEKPVLSGKWNRLMGPNYYLGLADNSGTTHQTFYPYKSQNKLGLTVNGTLDGLPSEIRMDIPNRNPNDCFVIPFNINISRGLKLDINSNVLENQDTTPILPLVKVKVVKGTFLWD